MNRIVLLLATMMAPHAMADCADLDRSTKELATHMFSSIGPASKGAIAVASLEKDGTLTENQSTFLQQIFEEIIDNSNARADVFIQQIEHIKSACSKTD